MVKSTPPTLAIPAAASLLAGACGDGAPTSEADTPLNPETEEIYTIGSLAGEDWEIFGNVGDVAFDGSGNLYVLDTQSKTLLVVDPSGQYLRQIGAPGEGPGEFSNPMSMAVLADGRIAVNDMMRALHLFESDGTLASSTSFQLPRMLGNGFVAREDGGLLAESPFTAFTFQGDVPETEEPGRNVDLYSADGHWQRTLYRAWDMPPMPTDSEIMESDRQGGQRVAFTMDRMRAFEPDLHLAPLSGNRIALADSTGYRVKVIGPEGALLTTVARQIQPEPVTDAVREAERERQSSRLSGGTVSFSLHGGEIDGGLADQLRASMAGAIENMAFADEIPVIDALATDREGRIWVQRTGPGGGADGPTDLLTADGDYLGTFPPGGVRIPNAFGPDGLMAYIDTGEMEVPVVRVVRLLSF